MKINFLGDLFLGGDLYYKNGYVPVISESYYDSDMRIANLEQPISNINEIANKSVVYSDYSAIKWLNKIKIRYVCLANNHIHDKTEKGLLDTIKYLKSNKINYFGCGINLKEARKHLIVAPSLAILGYCDFNKPYMKQILLAADNNPGVNPLDIKNILEDLEKLPVNTKAILYFHWGREHVWFPPYNDIKIAKTLLRHKKVIGIIGSHSHKVQGYIRYGQKRAYFSLGNFLFPNFFIKPQNQIYYSKKKPEKYSITKRYHCVSKLTYKKWSISNRISLLVNFDTKTKRFDHKLLKQRENEPCTEEFKGINSKLFSIWIELISYIYTFPKWLYKIFESTNFRLVSELKKLSIYSFLLKQNGYYWMLSKIRKKIYKIKNRIH